MVHDLRTLAPLPLSLPLQELPPVTACAFMPACAAAEVCLLLSSQQHVKVTTHMLVTHGCGVQCNWGTRCALSPSFSCVVAC
jgi:hypothetical protein